MAYRINDKFTFIHIPKNAGTSFREMFESSPDYKIEKFHSTQNHIEYDRLSTPWQDLMIAVVRNPWDRALSFYKFIKKKQIKRSRKSPGEYEYLKPYIDMINQGFENYVCKCYDKLIPTKSTNMSTTKPLEEWAQHKLLAPDLKNTVMLRMETLNDDWKKFCDDHNIPYQKLPVKNTSRSMSQRNQYRQAYTEQSKQVIAKIWQKDIELLGYEF